MSNPDHARPIKTAASACVAAFYFIQFGWIVAAHTRSGFWIFNTAIIVGAILPLSLLMGIALIQIKGLIRFSEFTNLTIILTTGFLTFLIWQACVSAAAAV